jgi:hypothetical protein
MKGRSFAIAVIIGGAVVPTILVEGSAADNKRDDRDFWAKGVDLNLL